MSEAMIMRCDYAWGEMVTLRVGSDFSIPLHPEHIARIDDSILAGEPCYIRDETHTEWLVEVEDEGDTIRFTEWNDRRLTCTVRVKDLFPE